MNAEMVGSELARWRRSAGLTQIQLAERMGTQQPVISRIEAGRSLPTLPLVERYARACGRKEIVLPVSGADSIASAVERRRRLRRVLGDFVFNPWDRDPTPAEARSLIADGLTRERFERQATDPTR
jgi:transcriptional regulator with XRE-family HTH domain